jgi:hypothetical protein
MEVKMDRGLEEFIAARKAEGHKFVVIDDGGCIGWGMTADQA